jgi:hypothetical protein
MTSTGRRVTGDTACRQVPVHGVASRRWIARARPGRRAGSSHSIEEIMMIRRSFPYLLAALGAGSLAGCAADPTPGSLDTIEVAVSTTAVIPSDATCVHIVATRLSDFTVSEFRGRLAGAVLATHPGETSITATAYPTPCGTEPAQAPWLADDQVKTFAAGGDTLRLAFHQNTSVTIDPVFDGTSAAVIEPGSRVRTGRNGEDVAGEFAIDGFGVTRIGYPARGGSGGPAESFLFSTEGKGSLDDVPRGITRTVEGNLLFQGSLPSLPLTLLDPFGNLLATWKVVVPAGFIGFNFTDGLDTIDATHFVRTGFTNRPVCNADRSHCQRGALEVLELTTDALGAPVAQVVQQFFLPDGPDESYPVGVASLGGGRFAVSYLPDADSAILVMDDQRRVLAGPVALPGDAEGLALTGDGRLAAVSYVGQVDLFDAETLAQQPETASYRLGAGVSTPSSLVWDTARNAFLTIDNTTHVVAAAADFSSAADLGLDLSGLTQPYGVAYRADTDEVLVGDSFGFDDLGSLATTLAVFNGVDATPSRTIVLAGIVPTTARAISTAYVASSAQLVTVVTRASGSPNPALEAVALVHDTDGRQVGTIDLSKFGLKRLFQVTYLPVSDELLFSASTADGKRRLVVTDAAGKPRRSLLAGDFAVASGFAQVASGPFIGQLGAVEYDPAFFFRATLP